MTRKKLTSVESSNINIKIVSDCTAVLTTLKINDSKPVTLVEAHSETGSSLNLEDGEHRIRASTKGQVPGTPLTIKVKGKTTEKTRSGDVEEDGKLVIRCDVIFLDGEVS